MTTLSKFKLFAVVALLSFATIDAMSMPVLQCKTCADGEAPEKPSPDNKNDGDSKAPSTPRPTK